MKLLDVVPDIDGAVIRDRSIDAPGGLRMTTETRVRRAGS